MSKKNEFKKLLKKFAKKMDTQEILEQEVVRGFIEYGMKNQIIDMVGFSKGLIELGIQMNNFGKGYISFKELESSMNPEVKEGLIYTIKNYLERAGK